MRRMAVLLVLVSVLSAGCLPLVMAEQAEYREAVRKGQAPPPALMQTCAQEGTVRAAGGAWVYDQELERACFARAGWRQTGRNGLGQPTWTRTFAQ